MPFKTEIAAFLIVSRLEEGRPNSYTEATAIATVLLVRVVPDAGRDQSAGSRCAKVEQLTGPTIDARTRNPATTAPAAHRPRATDPLWVRVDADRLCAARDDGAGRRSRSSASSTRRSPTASAPTGDNLDRRPGHAALHPAHAQVAPLAVLCNLVFGVAAAWAITRSGSPAARCSSR